MAFKQTAGREALGKFLKNEKRSVSADTILNYLKYCCDAYLFYQVKRQDLQGKQLLSSNEKYYIADHQILHATKIGLNQSSKRICFSSKVQHPRRRTNATF